MSAPVLQSLALPTDFGRYRLVKRIGVGGMAEIFLAMNRARPEGWLVVKRMRPHLSESEAFVSMFLDEVRLARQLRHPNIVEIFDAGVLDGLYFMAMEHVDGQDVRRVFNRAFQLQWPLPIVLSVRTVAEVAAGLDYAHGFSDADGQPLGIVHRDVTPQNILVGYDGTVKLFDFGVAKAKGRIAHSVAGQVKGKFSYVSPEQARGKPLDHRSDIFSLGVVLYELTTGIRLFKRKNEVDTLQAIVKCKVPEPTDVLEGYPKSLAQIMLKALSRLPEDRYANAAEFNQALNQFLAESSADSSQQALSDFVRDLFDGAPTREDSGDPTRRGGRVVSALAQAPLTDSLQTDVDLDKPASGDHPQQGEPHAELTPVPESAPSRGFLGGLGTRVEAWLKGLTSHRPKRPPEESDRPRD